MRFVASVVAGIMAFVAIGVITAKALLHHEVAAGAVAEQVRMGAWTGGLFAGGVGAVVVGLVVWFAWRGKQGSGNREQGSGR